MYLTRFHLIVIGGWFTAVALTVAGRFVLGAPPTLAQSLGAMAAAILPALMVCAVFKGAPPPTIAQVLYDAEHSRNPTRERLIATIQDAK